MLFSTHHVGTINGWAHGFKPEPGPDTLIIDFGWPGMGFQVSPGPCSALAGSTSKSRCSQVALGNFFRKFLEVSSAAGGGKKDWRGRQKHIRAPCPSNRCQSWTSSCLIPTLSCLRGTHLPRVKIAHAQHCVKHVLYFHKHCVHSLEWMP